jgi:RNA-directed DNA polymerase
LLQKINDPAPRPLLKGWLKAGIMDQGVFQETDRGTPQGGVISPLLANIALHGLEEDTRNALQSVLKQADKPAHRAWARVRKQLQIVRYADDFVVMHKNLSVIQEAKKCIAAWLGDMGLQLQPEKTRIVHTLHKFEGNEPGFDVLGFHCRQYSQTKGAGFKTLIKPGKNSIRRHLMSMNSKMTPYEPKASN